MRVTPPEVHVYLAGPDVFFPEARLIGQVRKEYLARLGMIGHFPFDNEVPAEVLSEPARAARLIAEANERMMLDCCAEGRLGVILANIAPFRSPSLDVGTAFEIGFMAALSHRGDVLITGYTHDPRPFEQRVAEDYYQGRITRQGGDIIGDDGQRIEPFGEADNLMITQAIARTGGRIFTRFEDAAADARRWADRQLAARGHAVTLPRSASPSG